MQSRATEATEFIHEKIRAACAQKGIQVNMHGDDFDLFQSGVFDSLGFVSLVTALEQKFGNELDFSEIDPEQFTTVKGLANVVAKASPTGPTE